MHVTTFFWCGWKGVGGVTRCRTIIMYHINFHYEKDNWDVLLCAHFVEKGEGGGDFDFCGICC